jgi:hypothetical protein
MTQNIQGFITGDGSVVIETKSRLPFKTKDIVVVGEGRYTILDIEIIREKQDLSNLRDPRRFTVRRIRMT